MGQSQSKKGTPAAPMVFVNEENPVPVRISSGFVDQLARSQPGAGTAQDIENQVRQRVQTELARIQQQDHQFANHKSDASSIVTEQELIQLSKQATEARKTPKVLPEEIVKAQDALVLCYKKNPAKSLDCWAEVQEFKDLVQKAQNAFIATA